MARSPCCGKSERMYVIHINETPLYLVAQVADAGLTPGPAVLIGRYPGKPRFLLHYIDMLEKGSKYEAVVLFNPDLPGLIADMESRFKIIEAAGGLVRNVAGEGLFIFRRGHWDLPKGKIDKGETVEAAAIREVQEETGIENVILGVPLPTTYHTYRNRKNKRVLKRTYWFEMTTTDTELVPQTEEDIKEARWWPVADYAALEGPMFRNIELVVRAGLER